MFHPPPCFATLGCGASFEAVRTGACVLSLHVWEVAASVRARRGPCIIRTVRETGLVPEWYWEPGKVSSSATRPYSRFPHAHSTHDVAHGFVAPRVVHVGERGRIKPSDVSHGGYACCGIHMFHSGARFPFGLTPYGCTCVFGRGSRHLPSKQCGGRVPPEKGVGG